MAWPDGKIRAIALRYIRKHTMDPEEWRFTRIGEWDPRIGVDVQAGEEPLVTIHVSASSWSMFTSRRIVGRFEGVPVDLSPLDVVDDRWGLDPKGIACGPTAVMTFETRRGQTSRLEFETGGAWLAPVYAVHFWRIKYPVLDNLVV